MRLRSLTDFGHYTSSWHFVKRGYATAGGMNRGGHRREASGRLPKTRVNRSIELVEGERRSVAVFEAGVDFYISLLKNGLHSAQIALDFLVLC